MRGLTFKDLGFKGLAFKALRVKGFRVWDAPVDKGLQCYRVVVVPYQVQFQPAMAMHYAPYTLNPMKGGSVRFGTKALMRDVSRKEMIDTVDTTKKYCMTLVYYGTMI